MVTFFTPAHLLLMLYTENSVSLYSSAADPTWINFTFRQAIHCNASTGHHLGCPRLTLKPLLPKASFHSTSLFLTVSVVSFTRTKSSACSNAPNTPFLANSKTTSNTIAQKMWQHRFLQHSHSESTLTIRNSLA